MTQFTPSSDQLTFGQPPAPPMRPRGQKTSVLAVLSLVLSLLICIPFAAPAAGLLFGIIALVLIGKSQDLLKGRGLAVAGVIISALVLCLNIALIVFLVTVVNKPAELVASLAQHVADDDLEAARRLLSPSAVDSVTDEDLAALKRRLAEECGTVDKVRLDLWGNAFARGVAPPAGGWKQSQAWQQNWSSAAATGASAEPLMPYPIKCTCSKGTIYGVAMMAIDPNSTADFPFLVDSFTLAGPDGPWTFPPVSTATNTEPNEPAEAEPDKTSNG